MRDLLMGMTAFPAMKDVRFVLQQDRNRNNILFENKGDLNMSNSYTTDVIKPIHGPIIDDFKARVIPSFEIVGIKPYTIAGVKVIKGDKKVFDEKGNFLKIEKEVNKEVEVYFWDGTMVKSVCSDNDEFSLSMGITCCLAKKLCGGTSEYNKAVDKAVKGYKKKLKREKELEIEKARTAAKRAKEKSKRAERKARKEAAAREAAIEIQAEAYRRALNSINNEEKTMGK